MIKRLTECFGPSGCEAAVREYIRAELPKGVDARVDALGSLIVHRKGSAGGRRVMVAAHMDEIGIVVTHVDKQGFLRFGSVGGVQLLPLMGGRVRFANGTPGMIGLEKLEDATRVPQMDKFYIDVGASGPDQCPVRVGDIACFDRPCEELGGRIVAKAMDDRIGCAVLLQTLKEITASPHELFFVFTVQEEVGLRGAATSGFGVEPEIALAVDVTLTGDTPECPPMAVSLGAGPAIKIKDSGMLSHAGVKDWLIRTAEEAALPFQREVLIRGTTDATAIQVSRAGVPAGCVSIPTRYTHTPSEMVDFGDVQASVQLLKSALTKPIDIG
ncbi:MAG: M20/M25/M40 family metallo-hydrolase [Spirochaetia bacterium]|jgi:endoglucanase